MFKVKIIDYLYKQFVEMSFLLSLGKKALHWTAGIKKYPENSKNGHQAAEMLNSDFRNLTFSQNSVGKKSEKF